MKLAVALVALILTAAVSDARRPPVCATDAAYPRDLPQVLCPTKIERAPGGGQTLTFAISYDGATPEAMAKMYAIALTQMKWKVTRTGTSLTARHGHDKVSVTVTAAGTGVVVQLIYQPA